MRKINLIDLFAGCGGLLEGFKQTGHYHSLACVEWDKDAKQTLALNLASRWKYTNTDRCVLQFDLQRTKELLHGWEEDEEYNSHPGLINAIGSNPVDIIIGGPPCQAYSIAGRIRDENGMHNDYRNYLFESYLEIVKQFLPKVFVFENVPGLLSANPEGINIVNEIRKSFKAIGYSITDNLKDTALLDCSDYGVPQNRKRVIIIGIKDNLFTNKDTQDVLNDFYNNILSKYKKRKSTVKDALSDLPKLYPLKSVERFAGRNYSHSFNSTINGHHPRYHNQRDIEIFSLLAKDIESGDLYYTNSDSLIELYYEKTGKRTNIHKYHVLRWNEQSNTIPAHLYKDGLRHIHPDSSQARSITVREAARLQSFPDDFIFNSSMTSNYKMIGNAVPPKFAKAIGYALSDFFTKYKLYE